MRCNTPTSFSLRPQITLRCFPSCLIRDIMSLLTRLSRYYSPSIPNTNGLSLQGSITQQLLRTVWGSWTNRRSLVSNPVIHALSDVIILASVRVLMSFTWPKTGKSGTIRRTCRFCSTSRMCFLKRSSLNTFWEISSFSKIVLRSGEIHGTSMQIFLWMGGMIISYNPLGTQFSITIMYAPRFSLVQCSCLYLFEHKKSLSESALRRAIQRRGVHAPQ